MELQDTERILIYGIFRRKRMIISLLIGILGTVILGSLLWTPVYESTSTILIRGRNYQDPLFRPPREGPWTVLMNPKDEINSEIEIIRSRPVLEGTVEALALHNPRLASRHDFWGGIRSAIQSALRPIQEWFRSVGLSSEPSRQEALEHAIIRLDKSLRVEPAVESQVIRIAYRDHDPVMASKVVNTVVEKYLYQHLMVNLNRYESSFYLEQTGQIQSQLKELQEQLITTKKAYGIFSLADQMKALIEKINSFDIALTTVQKEIISRRSKVFKIQQVRKAKPHLLIPLPELAKDNQVQDLENKLINLLYEQKTVQDRYTDQSRQVVTISRQIKELQEEIKRQVSQLLDREIVELSKMEAEEQALSQTIQELKSEVQALPLKQVTLANLERDIAAKEEVLSVLRKKYQDGLVMQATDYRLENAKVVSPGSVPLKPVQPNLPLNAALGLLFALIVSLSLAFFLEYLDDSIGIPEDVERGLGLTVLSSIEEL